MCDEKIPQPFSEHTYGGDEPRNARGQFAPGHPGFKPKGARHRATRMLEEICADNARDVMLAMVEKAKAGDTTAAKLVLERVCPPLREPLREPIEVDLHTEGGALAALQALAQRAAEGTLPAGEAKDIAMLLGAVVSAHRTELESKVQVALEKVHSVLAERSAPREMTLPGSGTSK